MTTIKTLTAVFALGVAATCVVPQAFARPHATSGFEANAQAIGPELAARAAAVQRGAIIRACNEAAAPFREYTGATSSRIAIARVWLSTARRSSGRTTKP